MSDFKGDLRTRVNAAVQALAAEKGARYKVLLDEDIVAHVLQTVKQRLHSRANNKKNQQLVRAAKELLGKATALRNEKRPFEHLGDDQLQALIDKVRAAHSTEEALAEVPAELREIVEEEAFGIREADDAEYEK